MLHFPNAKINIGLFVTEKRADGYHNLESVFYPLPMLKDALEVLPIANQDVPLMRISGREIEGAPNDNLVWKAWHILHQDFPIQVKPLAIHLLKAIPMGAGLGGGSADGAFMLRLMNRYFDLQLSDFQLADYALQLGSDCPFFIYNTAQFAKGRGELLQAIDLDLSDFSIQVICPKLHVSTKGAFAQLTPKPAPIDLATLHTIPIDNWKGLVYNDFEPVIFKSYPMLADIKVRLYDEGALYASMSGSGSAIYGIFPKGKQASFVTNSDWEVFCCA